MSKRITTSGSMTPGQIRKSPPVSSNTQRAFEYDMDDFEADENEFDGNYPIIRDVPFYSQQQGQSSIQISNHNKNTGFYYTPQTKRKRVQDQVADSPDSFKEQLDLLQNILKDVNRKVDILNTKEDAFQEKLDHVHQHLGSLIRKGNKNPTPNEPPVELPIIVSICF
ncbi:unnamed protein product [Rotaria magnacalcarata]|uniref:Uncharacterized protein n=1 Tax=Rotaria magnacalcarata TaxID=392030 RepID=A0A8S2W2H5_9BILA|nr:unnamed protein product [Rotaria magnacalcarata]